MCTLNDDNFATFGIQALALVLRSIRLWNYLYYTVCFFCCNIHVLTFVLCTIWSLIFLANFIKCANEILKKFKMESIFNWMWFLLVIILLQNLLVASCFYQDPIHFISLPIYQTLFITYAVAILHSVIRFRPNFFHFKKFSFQFSILTLVIIRVLRCGKVKWDKFDILQSFPVFIKNL